MHVLTILSALSAMAMSPAAPTSTVSVRALAEVAGATFTLGDVAEIRSTDPAFAGRLAAVPMGTSPLPGLARGLYPSDVTARLKVSGIDPTTVTVMWPPAIRIVRTGGRVAVDQVTEAARAAVIAAYSTQPDDLRVECAMAPASIYVPSGTPQFQAGKPVGSPESGQVSVPVAVVVNGQTVRTIDVPVKIERRTQAVVASRSLEAGAILTPSDVVMGRVDRRTAVGAETIEQAVGKKLTRRTNQGQPVTVTDVANTPVVGRGDAVSVTSSAGGISISVPGVARAAGGIGERIRVYVEKTRREVPCVVLDRGTVRVEEIR